MVTGWLSGQWRPRHGGAGGGGRAEVSQAFRCYRTDHLNLSACSPLPFPRPAQAPGLGSPSPTFWNNETNICYWFSSSDPLSDFHPGEATCLGLHRASYPFPLVPVRSAPASPLPPGPVSRVVPFPHFLLHPLRQKGDAPFTICPAPSPSHTSKYSGEKMAEQEKFSPWPSLAQGWREDSRNLKWKISWSKGRSGRGE